MPAMDSRVEQLESRVAELEAQNRLLERQRAETEKALAQEKRGNERATLYADSFAFKLIGTLTGLDQKGRDATEAREDATEGKLHLERLARESMVREPPCFPFE
jgi:hypothetical protein